MSDREPFWGKETPCRKHCLGRAGWTCYPLPRFICGWLLAAASLLACGMVAEASGAQPTLLWQVEGIAVGANPTRGADGTIYVGKTNGLAAYSPGGSEVWVYPTGPSRLFHLESCVAVAADGSIAYSSGSSLLVLNANGTLRWIFQADTTIAANPTIASDGTIYVGTQGTYNPATGYYLDGKLVAVRPDGTKAWEFTTGNAVTGSAAVGKDGTIYFGSWDRSLYALNPNGSLKWAFPTAGFFVAGPAIGADGVVFAANLQSRGYAVNPDGTQKWVIFLGDKAYWSPTIAPDGTLYGFGTKGGASVVGAFSSDGLLKWSYAKTGTSSSASRSSCTIAQDGSIIFASPDLFASPENGYVQALHADGTLKWTLNLLTTLQPLLAPDGTLYVSSVGALYPSVVGTLMAFATDSGLANAPWPMFGRGPGRAGNHIGSVGATPTSPLIVNQPTSQVVAAGSNVRLQANAVGSDSLGFQWSRDGVAITNATQPWLALPNVQRTNSGSYQLQVTNALGVMVSSNTLLRVQGQQSLTSAKLLGSGHFQFMAADLAGAGIGPNDLAYIEVQASTNLSNWETLTNSAVLTNGQMLIEDPSALLPPRRYYRVLQR